MRRIPGVFLAAAVALSPLVSHAAAQAEFTLVKTHSGDPFARLGKYTAGNPSESRPSQEVVTPKKKPWLAALEIIVPVNIGIWAVDRYAYNRGYAHISWESWKRNLSRGWIWDPDPLSASFFGHVYHGSLFFNTARSLGLSFWESVPYAAGGYLMWGYFFENDPVSINDTIITTLGGIHLGEIEFRLSSLILDDKATGAARVWREIFAFIVDPIRGFNRLVSSDVSKTSSENGQLREPFHGSLSFAGDFVSQTSGLTSTKFAPSFDFDLTYGIGGDEIAARHPFDLIFLNGGLRFGPDGAHFDLDTGGLWLGKELGGEGGPKHVLGIFQFYDYDNNEVIRFGGTSFTAGLVSLFPMKHGFELKTSVQLGALVLGGATNPYVLVGQRNYNYGSGLAARFQAWLKLSGLGSVTFRVSHFENFTIEGAATSEANESRDFLTFLDASYTLPVSRSLEIRLDYGQCVSRQHFEGRPDVHGDLSKIGAALDVRF